VSRPRRAAGWTSAEPRRQSVADRGPRGAFAAATCGATDLPKQASQVARVWMARRPRPTPAPAARERRPSRRWSPSPRGAGHSHELSFPFSDHGVGSHIATKLPPPPVCALRFSQPLSALVLSHRSGFVSPRWRSWGSFPSEVFPRWKPNASRLVLPLVVFPTASSTFRGFSNQRIRAHTEMSLKPPRRPILSWVSSSPGYSPAHDGERVNAASPHTLSAASALGRTQPGAPGCRSMGGLACLFRELPTPMRSLSSSRRFPLRA